MATAAISIAFTDESTRLMDEWRKFPQLVGPALERGVIQVLQEAESEVKNTQFGPDGVINNRSGNLRQDITHKRTDRMEGVVGTTSRTAPYARTILGPGSTTITPKSAGKRLWIPVADNLNPSGVARFSPRAFFDTFDRKRIKIFTSKNGNKVVFLEDRDAEGRRVIRKRDGRGRAEGRKAGEVRGKLMFVLKDRVVIQGTDALASAVREYMPRAQEVITEKLREVLT
ncbi:hypothetical protein HNQ40_001026 [Algisphaera agarilytica]|uniref:Uncharacterized protein n=2 Tax=Algisphaera agarilytica TaxID=1385975 RepID=A0A7X0H7G5_9BACT|nr:hypothetical protein [Algisphaera agarilytica]